MKKLPLLLAVVAFASCQRFKSQAEPVDAGPAPVVQPAPPPVDPLVAAGLERVSIVIDGPLELGLKGALAAEVASPLAQVTARLLVWWVDVARGLRRGDTLDIVYSLPPGKEPLVHALRFYSNKNGKEYRAYLFRPKSSAHARFFDEGGAEVEERLVNSPIDDYEQVTSILRDGRGHRGVDFKAPVGTPVKMPFDARLTRKNWSFRGNGNCLELKDGKGRRIVFLHLDVLPKNLAIGKHYRTGEVVASSGNSGHSTAPHLHYQLENASGKLLDPFVVHQTHRVRLETAELGEFQAKRDGYDRMLAPQQAPAVVAAPAPAAPAPAVPAPAAIPGAAAPGAPGSAGADPQPAAPADLGQ